MQQTIRLPQGTQNTSTYSKPSFSFAILAVSLPRERRGTSTDARYEFSESMFRSRLRVTNTNCKAKTWDRFFMSTHHIDTTLAGCSSRLMP